MYILLSNNNYHEDWIFEHLKPLIQPEDKVVVLPFAFHEDWINSPETWEQAYNPIDGKYYLENVGPFQRYGIDLNQVQFLNYFKHTKVEMEALIQEANILFFTGGLPDKAAARMESLSLTDAVVEHKGLKIGVSAGALMQFPKFFVSPDDDYPELGYHNGLNTIHSPHYLEVHYERSNMPQQLAIKDALSHHCEKVYAIGQQGAIFIDGDQWKRIGEVAVFIR